MARTYRAEKETDIARPLPLELVLHTVLESAYSLSLSPAHSAPTALMAKPAPSTAVSLKELDAESIALTQDADNKVTFFPEESELLAWARLSIQARVQMSSSHHLKVRGTLLVKDELLRVARTLKIAVWKDIFEVQTLQEMETLIQEYEAIPNKERAALHEHAHTRLLSLQEEHEQLVAMRGSSLVGRNTAKVEGSGFFTKSIFFVSLAVAAGVGALVSSVLLRKRAGHQ